MRTAEDERTELASRVQIELDSNIQLETIGRAEVGKRFPEAFQAAVKNIVDMSYPAAKPRTIIVEIALIPTADRSVVDFDVNVKTKFPDRVPQRSRAYLVPAGDSIIVSESDPEQPHLGFK